LSKGIYIKDDETAIHISYDDILKYHGRSYIAGVALAYKMMELAFDFFQVSELLSRKYIQFRIGVYGPGIIDAIEMVTRAKTHNRMIIDQNIAKYIDAPEAADGYGGKYYFEIFYRTRKISLSLKKGIIPQEFITISNKFHDGSITEGETIRLKELKEEIAGFIMKRVPADLFNLMVEKSPSS